MKTLFARILVPVCLFLASPLVAGDFLGAGRMYRFDQVTVVYPAGEGEPIADNRLSAERRAAFLRDVHGVNAEVAADDEVTDEQKKGHLLLLGWGNRLLGTEVAPSPIKVDEAGNRSFLGVKVREDHDLLFIHDSPYNLGEKWLVFWSRLDLELDRFQVLPLSAADWAVYRDYLAVQDGAIIEEVEWPPRRDPASDNTNAAVRPGLRGHSAHYALHYPGTTMDEARSNAILEARERALARAVAELGAPPKEYRLHLYLYADRDDKLARSGVPDPTHVLPRKRELHMLYEEAEGDGFREELHALAYERFGPAYSTALYEGVAAAHAAPFDEGELPVFAALLLDRDSFPTVEQLFDESILRRLNRAGVGFAASGLLAYWIESTGGREALGTVYREKAPDPGVVSRALELPPDDVDAAFRKWAKGVAEGAQDELAFRSAKADARTLAAQQRHAEAAEHLARASELKPDDRRTVYDLALAQMAAERFAEAEESLERLIRMAVEGGDERYVVFGVYQKARLYDRQGRREEAVAEFRKVLDLPDVNDIHRLAREQIELPASSN